MSFEKQSQSLTNHVFHLISPIGDAHKPNDLILNLNKHNQWIINTHAFDLMVYCAELCPHIVTLTSLSSAWMSVTFPDLGWTLKNSLELVSKVMS